MDLAVPVDQRHLVDLGDEVLGLVSNAVETQVHLLALQASLLGVPVGDEGDAGAAVPVDQALLCDPLHLSLLDQHHDSPLAALGRLLSSGQASSS